MKILITAGGTQEPIDSVRSICNHATGRLGTKIADAFSAFPDTERIVYLCGKTAVLPETDQAEIIRIQGTAELEAALRKLNAEDHFDAIIHGMAVSDYQVRQVTSVSAMAAAAAACENRGETELEKAIAEAAGFDSNGKISSTVDDLVILLEKTPKVISMLRELAPHAVIVGFKLLDHVSKEELLDTAYHLLQANRCDFVLANDMTTVNSPLHCGFLLDERRNCVEYQGKNEIACGIAAAVRAKVGENV